MKILDRYLIRSFFGPFMVCIAVFCLLVLMGRFFDKMSVFNEYHASPKHIALYLLYGLPYWLNLVMPIATMLALLFSLGHLNIGGEITAMRGAGISPLRLYRPYFGIGLVLSIISLVGGLTVWPKLNFESRAIYRVDIKKREVLSFRRDNLVVAGQERRRFTIGMLDPEGNRLKAVVVDRFDERDTLIETLVAREAVFLVPRRWQFMDGVLRTFPAGNLADLQEEVFTQKEIPIPEKPQDFALEDKDANDMTGKELLHRISRLKLLGAPYTSERVDFHLRIALPFANLVVILLAIPIVLSRRQSNRTQTFAYAFMAAFLFWGATSVWKSIGEQGYLPAWVAAWMSNILFLAYASWRFTRPSIG